MISGRYGHISHTSDETDKTPKVVAEIQTVSRTNSSSSTGARKPLRKMAPFIAAHDIPRGAIHAFQALLGYTLMLAIMYVLLWLLCVLGTHHFLDSLQDVPGCLYHFNYYWIGFRRSSFRENGYQYHTHSLNRPVAIGCIDGYFSET
jgi:hypothetical protein